MRMYIDVKIAELSCTKLTAQSTPSMSSRCGSASSRLRMSYQAGIDIPPFRVTGSIGAVGQITCIVISGSHIIGI